MLQGPGDRSSKGQNNAGRLSDFHGPQRGGSENRLLRDQAQEPKPIFHKTFNPELYLYGLNLVKDHAGCKSILL